MNLYYTKNFIRDYQRLPQSIQKITDKQLENMLSNPQHPSLGIKKMKDPRQIWEGRITKSYRFTFQFESDVYILRRIGTHDILKKP